MESHSERKGAAVLGSPITHSLSPVLHQAAYDVLGLSDWRYRAVECRAEELDSTLDRLAAEGLAGVSLTMPLKRTVMPRLARADRWTELVGGANTVLFDRVGWRGANTDVPGMVTALRTTMTGQVEGGTPAIIGAGATAAAAIAALGQFAIRGVEVFARRPSVARGLEPLAESLSLALTVHGWDELAAVAGADVVVSTTPAGATDELAQDLTSVSGTLFDVVYVPWPTPLARAWVDAGGSVLGGLELLVEQAALQVELMTGREAPVAAMRDAGYAALNAQA